MPSGVGTLAFLAWQPLQGPATLNPGVPGTLGTITRQDGSVQATCEGNPLHTYLSDTAPGTGDGLNLSGGVASEGAMGTDSSPPAGRMSTERDC